MSSLRKRKCPRRAARTGVLAGAIAAALAVGAISAGSATAEPLCTGSNLKGEGSSAQFIAQTKLWIPGFQGEKNAFGEPGVCFEKGTKPQVSYTGPGSSAGLDDWNLKFSGGTGINTEFGFVATDVAPTSAEIANAESAAGGANVLVIPVAQTAIGVIVNPPANCTVKEISNKQLENAFRGGVTLWSQFDASGGAGCAGQPVTRIVRSGSGSGTTFQFKRYLHGVNSAELACTEPTSTWAGLGRIGSGTTPGAANPNITWPEKGVGGCESLSPVERAAGTSGAALVGKVNEKDGSIGYAALPDVQENKTGDTATVKVQNNGLVKFANASFASPIEGANASANCYQARYAVPPGAGTGKSIDWSEVFGADNAIANTAGDVTAYPLCMLTYDIAFNDYSKKAGFTEGQVQTVKDYLNEYVVQAAGQLALEEGGKFYAPLPTGGSVAYDVLQAAQTAAGKIGF